MQMTHVYKDLLEMSECTTVGLKDSIGLIVHPLKSVFNPSKHTLMCLSIGTPKNNEFSICSKWKIHYF